VKLATIWGNVAPRRSDVVKVQIPPFPWSAKPKHEASAASEGLALQSLMAFAANGRFGEAGAGRRDAEQAQKPAPIERSPPGSISVAFEPEEPGSKINPKTYFIVIIQKPAGFSPNWRRQQVWRITVPRERFRASRHGGR
jgi:hypothetical protein